MEDHNSEDSHSDDHCDDYSDADDSIANKIRVVKWWFKNIKPQLFDIKTVNGISMYFMENGWFTWKQKRAINNIYNGYKLSTYEDMPHNEVMYQKGIFWKLSDSNDGRKWCDACANEEHGYIKPRYDIINRAYWQEGMCGPCFNCVDFDKSGIDVVEW